MYVGFISLKSVIDRIMRHPLMTDASYESLVVWSLDVIRLIGSTNFMQSKIMRLGIENYRCTKPEDMIYMKQARRVVKGINMDKDMSTWAFEPSPPGMIWDYPEDGQWTYASTNLFYNPQTTEQSYEPMYESTDPFHEFYDKSNMHGIAPHNTYKFNGNYVYTSFNRGIIDIAYDGIMVDEDGVPMMPNDPTIEKAIEAYVKSQYFGIMADLGRDTLHASERAEKEYCWYIGQAQSHAALLSIDGRQALSNTMNTLIRNGNPHSSFFRDMGHPEQIKKQ